MASIRVSCPPKNACHKRRSCGLAWKALKLYKATNKQKFQFRCQTGFGDLNNKDAEKEHNLKTGKWISDRLESINLVLVGDNTELNFALGSAIAPLIGYTPLHTSSILQQLKTKDVAEIIAEDEEEELGLSEAMILESLSNHLRCVISTCGNGIGAAARAACWRYIFGALTLWIDCEENDGSGLQYEAYGLCDIQLKIRQKNELIDSASAKETLSLVSAILPQLLSAVRSKLEEESGLCKKKGLYVRLGCRGDWPNLEPPDWTPNN